MQSGACSRRWSDLVCAWSLSKEQMDEVDQRCREILCPAVFKKRELCLFARQTHFNTKDKQRFFTTWGEYVLQGIMDPECFQFFCSLCALLTSLVNQRVPKTQKDQDAARKLTLETMVEFDGRVPNNCHTLATHTTEHATDKRLHCGPLPMCWGWEHFQGRLTR